MDKVRAIDSEIQRLEAELEGLGFGMDSVTNVLKRVASFPKSANKVQAAITAFIQEVVKPIEKEYKTTAKYSVVDGNFENVKDDVMSGKPDGQWVITRGNGEQVYLFYYASSPFAVSVGMYKEGIKLSDAFKHKEQVTGSTPALRLAFVKAMLDQAQ